MKNIIQYPIAFTVAAFLTFPVMANSDTTPKQPLKSTAAEQSSEHPKFAEMDTNKDSNISITEAKGNDWLARNFVAIDANKDGLISFVEFLVVKDKA